jgi:sugar phosphate permease
MQVRVLSIVLLYRTLLTWLSSCCRCGRRCTAQDGNQILPTFLFVLEAGSFVGGIGAGVVSDKVFNGGRMQPMVLSSLLCALSLAALSQAAALPALVVYAIIACVGAFAFAPHMLFGLAAREIVPSEVSSTAGGFVKGIGQLGGAVAGQPFGLLLQSYGWTAGHALLIGSALLSAVAILPLMKPTKPKSE